MIHQAGFVQPGTRREIAVRDRHADRRREAAAQRAGGHINAVGVPVFRMARRLAAPLAKFLDVVDGKAEFKEMQQRIEQHGAVSGGKHETVAPDPRRILRIDAQVLAPQRHREIRAAERHAGMARLRFLDRVGRKHSDGIGSELRFG